MEKCAGMATSRRHLRDRVIGAGIARGSLASPAEFRNGSLQERARLEEPDLARLSQAASRQHSSMDSQRAKARALEAEITALRRACIETQAPGDDDSQVRYVAFPRPGEVGDSLFTRGAPDLPTNFSRALDVGWNLSVCNNRGESDKSTHGPLCKHITIYYLNRSHFISKNSLSLTSNTQGESLGCLLRNLPFTDDEQYLIVQSLSRVRLFAIAWTAARQAFLFFTNSWSWFILMSTESVMPSSHLVLCRPLLLLPSVFPSITVFSNESAFSSGGRSIGASASASVPPMNIQG